MSTPSLLIDAIMNGDITLAKELLLNGHDPNERFVSDPPNEPYSGHGRPALHFAVSLHQNTITRLLLEGGADPNILDKSGEAAIHIMRKTATEIHSCMK